jgi:hypothetical protein
MSYLTAAKGALDTIVSIGTIASWVSPNPEKGRPQFVDPILALCRVAILNFRPEGTKLHIKDNDIVNDHPTLIQGAKRAKSGVGNEDLHNINAALYHAVTWIKPTYHENRDYKIIFLLAKKGLIILRDTTYEKKEWVRQIMHFGLGILEKSLEGKPITFEAEVIPDWSNNILAQASYYHWTEKPGSEDLKTIAQLFKNAYKDLIKTKEKEQVDIYIEAIKKILDKTTTTFKKFHETMKVGKTIPCPIKKIPERDKIERKEDDILIDD